MIVHFFGENTVASVYKDIILPPIYDSRPLRKWEIFSFQRSAFYRCKHTDEYD